MDSTAAHPSALRTMLGHLAWMQVMIGIACLVGVFTSLRVATIVAISLILLVATGLAVRRAALKMNTIFDEELDRRDI
jgi:4-hydroxybenzoate polyprenyltransferase